MTPIVELALTVAGRRRAVFLKLEGESWSGSVKGRTARSLVSDLERRGVLGPESILIESTSGNLGVALAQIAHARRYRFVAVVDPKTSAENVARMRRLGTLVELVESPDETGGYLLSRLDRVRELCASSHRFVWPDQYSNAANPRAHELETGPELYGQMGGSVDAVAVAVSTGGTLAGLARFLRRASPGTTLIAVDAAGSVALGGAPGPRLLTGIGASQPSQFLTTDLFDERLVVADEEAFSLCHAVRAATGLALGGSSGAVLAAIRRFLEANPDAERVVCLCADGGEGYMSTIYDRNWLEVRGLELPLAA